MEGCMAAHRKLWPMYVVTGMNRWEHLSSHFAKRSGPGMHYAVTKTIWRSILSAPLPNKRIRHNIFSSQWSESAIMPLSTITAPFDCVSQPRIIAKPLRIMKAALCIGHRFQR